TSALPKYIDAKSRNSGDPIRQVGGAILLEFSHGRFVLAHQVVGDVTRVLWAERFETLVLQLNELSTHLNLWRAPRRKDQVADVTARFEHGCHELSGMDRSLWRLRRRGYWSRCGQCLCRSSHG